jgi:hypothetical protein
MELAGDEHAHGEGLVRELVQQCVRPTVLAPRGLPQEVDQE